MSLATPNLDDRRFQDLVDEAKRMVQKRCPEWTDHNVPDPGVTLIETFAYMVDQLIYRLNRVPDRLYVEFLHLLGVDLPPPPHGGGGRRHLPAFGRPAPAGVRTRGHGRVDHPYRDRGGRRVHGRGGPERDGLDRKSTR